MPTFRVEIPNWLPATINTLLGLHWANAQKLKRADAQMVAAYALQAGVPHAEGKRKLTLTFAAPGGRGAKTGDPDARLKSALDALVRCGMLVDDSPTWLELGAVTCVKGKRQTVIVLEDVTEPTKGVQVCSV